MFKAIIEGRVLAIEEKEYTNRKSEKVVENVVSVFQEGSKELLEISVPQTFDISVDAEFSALCDVRIFGKENRAWAMISLSK